MMIRYCKAIDNSAAFLSALIELLDCRSMRCQDLEWRHGIQYLMEEQNEESNSLFSGSNMMPLAKRQTVSKKPQKSENNLEEKIEGLGYQLVEELGLITPLDLHPNKISDCIDSFHYQRHLSSLTDSDFNRKDAKERADFIMALTSLFRKATTAPTHKFTLLLPNGVIYYFSEGSLQPRLLVASQNGEFGPAMQRQEIKAKEWKAQEFEREGFLLEGQQIRLFFGFILNWALAKKASVQVYANYSFDLALKDIPLAIKHSELRKEYSHLSIQEETCIGERPGKLYFIRFQTIWYRDDIIKLEQRLKQLEAEHERKNKNQKLSHDFEMKFNKYTLGLNQALLERLAKITQ